MGHDFHICSTLDCCFLFTSVKTHVNHLKLFFSFLDNDLRFFFLDNVSMKLLLSKRKYIYQATLSGQDLT